MRSGPRASGEASSTGVAPPAEALGSVRAFVDGTLAGGATPVLLASPLAVGPDLIAALGATYPLRAHRAFVEAARKLRTLGHDLPAVARLVGPPVAPGEVVLWPPARREAAIIRGLPFARAALVSGWACDPEVTARLRVDAAIPLGEQADHQALLEYIAATGAQVVHLLSGGGREGDLVAALAGRGVRVQRVGPPEQLRLL